MKVTYKIRKMSGNKESITIDPCTLEQLTALFENELIGEVLVTREVEELTPIEWLTENMPQISQYIPLAISLELHSKVQIAKQMERDIIKANTIHQDSSTEPLINKVKAFNQEIDRISFKRISENIGYILDNKNKTPKDYETFFFSVNAILNFAKEAQQPIPSQEEDPNETKDNSNKGMFFVCTDINYLSEIKVISVGFHQFESADNFRRTAKEEQPYKNKNLLIIQAYGEQLN